MLKKIKNFQSKLSLHDCYWEMIFLYLQTQPVPNPISYYMHQSPEVFHKFETLSNHIVELIVPFLLFLPRPLRMVGGAIQILFQVCRMDFDIWPLRLIMKRKFKPWYSKFKQWYPTILPISAKRTTTFHLKSLNIEKTLTYYVGNPDPDLGQA